MDFPAKKGDIYDRKDLSTVKLRLELKNWHKIRKNVENEAEKVYEIKIRAEKELEGLRKGIPQTILTEKPSDEVVKKLDEFSNRLETFELLGLSLNTMDYVTRGIDFYTKKDYKFAIKAYSKAIEMDSNFAIAWYNRACSYAVMGNKKNALFDLEKAIELNDSYKEQAKKDEDFKTLWDDEDFKKLVE